MRYTYIMNFLAILFDQKNSDKQRQWNIMLTTALALLTLWVVSVINFGFSLPVYLLTMVFISIMIFLTPTLGLPVIILATMWFQRWFTLEPIVFGDQIYKIYPLDVVFLMTIFALFFHHIF